MRIVVAEDEGFARKSLIKLIGQISDQYLVVGEATDGEDALSLVQTLHPDLVITDIRMPKMDGLQLVGKVARLGGFVRCVIVSGYSDFDYARSAIRHGVKEYIVKPFTYQDISDCLARMNAQIEQDYHIRAPRADSPLFPLTVLPNITSCNFLVTQAIHVIEDNIAKSCTLGEVSGKLGVSGEHLSRLFHTETGMTFSRYVTVAKIDNSMMLMRNTGMKINEIAHASGYQNINYFYRIFKNVTGFSTSEYLAFCQRK